VAWSSFGSVFALPRAAGFLVGVDVDVFAVRLILEAVWFCASIFVFRPRIPSTSASFPLIWPLAKRLCGCFMLVE